MTVVQLAGFRLHGANHRILGRSGSIFVVTAAVMPILSVNDSSAGTAFTMVALGGDTSLWTAITGVGISTETPSRTPSVLIREIKLYNGVSLTDGQLGDNGNNVLVGRYGFVNAISFDGGSGFITTTDTSILSGLTQFSLFWMQVPSVDGSQRSS